MAKKPITRSKAKRTTVTGKETEKSKSDESAVKMRPLSMRPKSARINAQTKIGIKPNKNQDKPDEEKLPIVKMRPKSMRQKSKIQPITPDKRKQIPESSSSTTETTKAVSATLKRKVQRSRKPTTTVDNPDKKRTKRTSRKEQTRAVEECDNQPECDEDQQKRKRAKKPRTKKEIELERREVTYQNDCNDRDARSKFLLQL